MNPEADQVIADTRERVVSAVAYFRNLPHASTEARVMECYAVLCGLDAEESGSAATFAAVAIRLLSEYQDVLERCEKRIDEQDALLARAGLARRIRYKLFRPDGWSKRWS